MTTTLNSPTTIQRRFGVLLFAGAAAGLIGIAAAGTAAANPTPVMPVQPGHLSGPRLQTHIPVGLTGQDGPQGGPGNCVVYWDTSKAPNGGFGPANPDNCTVILLP